MMQPDELVAAVVREYLELDAEQIWFYNQRRDVPKDSRMYVILSMGNRSIIGSALRVEEDGTEVSAVTMSAPIVVETVSRSREALERVPELVMALRNGSAQRKMTTHGMRIFRSSDILDISAVEGAAGLHRYRVTLTVHYAQSRTTQENFYEHFPQEEVTDE